MISQLQKECDTQVCNWNSFAIEEKLDCEYFFSAVESDKVNPFHECD